MNTQQAADMMRRAREEQFNLRRINPFHTNARIENRFLGYQYNEDIRQWEKVSSRIIRDKELLEKIMSIVEGAVNPEVRLGKFDKDEQRLFSLQAGMEIVAVLFRRGNELARDVMPLMNIKGELIGNSKQSAYVDKDGNTEYILILQDNNDVKKVKNIEFTERCKSIESESIAEASNLSRYIYSNYSRALQGVEAKQVSGTMSTQEVRQYVSDERGSGFSIFGKNRGKE